MSNLKNAMKNNIPSFFFREQILTSINLEIHHELKRTLLSTFNKKLFQKIK